MSRRLSSGPSRRRFRIRSLWTGSAALLLLFIGAGVDTSARVIADWGRALGPDAGSHAWKTRIFDQETRYRVLEDGRADRASPVLHAEAQDSASALYREIEIDLNRTPCLQWSWRADAFPRLAGSEKTRSGDDFAVRLYVVREGWLGLLGTRALAYVWSQDQPAGARWSNPYTEATVMWALDGSEPGPGRWARHVRNLREDWRVAFGEEIDRIDGVAIMTDADDSGSTARGRYGAIRAYGGSTEPRRRPCADRPETRDGRGATGHAGDALRAPAR